MAHDHWSLMNEEERRARLIKCVREQNWQDDDDLEESDPEAYEERQRLMQEINDISSRLPDGPALVMATLTEMRAQEER